MTICCVIIDDEPLARRGLKEYIAEVDFLALVGEFENALKSTELIAAGGVHLLFLDIQMPRITGIDFFKTLKNPPPVIFTTAYPEFALEGFEVNALDYLVKPVSSERFLKAVLKAREYYEVRDRNSTGGVKGADHFFIKADNKLVKVLYDEVIVVEALQNYVVIHTSGKKYMTYLTFKSIEDYLPSDKFVKVHKSYIVSVSKIDSIEGNDLRLGTHHVPISRNLKEEVMDRLLKGKFLKR